jgi:hypothetical protein
MTLDRYLSRPLRLAAQLRGEDEATLEHLFRRARVLVSLENGFAHIVDAREAFLLAVNQTLRFCPNVAIRVPGSARDLVAVCDALAFGVHGEGHRVERTDQAGRDDFDAIITVGVEVMADPRYVTINSSGWVARVAGSSPAAARLHWTPAESNPIGAVAAACLGVGRVFLTLIGHSTPPMISELSLFTYEIGAPGSIALGPPLPSNPLELDAFLVGCGAVSNGWAYAIKRLPVKGRLQAVDRQSLGDGNIGPYVAAVRQWIGRPKAEILREFLGPRIAVTPRPEEFELFKLRLGYGQIEMPRLVVNGLDNVETRHAVQRLWPPTLIDMAAGGTTAQVVVKQVADDSLCLLRALTLPAGETNAERLARETGLSLDRVRDPESPITEADVAAAPAGKRPTLEADRRQGQLVCGRITDHNLHGEEYAPDFAPAAPFVTAFSGVVGAAETMKYLMSVQGRPGLHFQAEFRSGRSRALQVRCDSACECAEPRAS